MILREPEPVKTAHLLTPMRKELIKVLRDLREPEWRYPTACAGWTVKDVALHLLGDDIGLLSRRRDGFSHTQTDFEHFEELVAFINLQNDIWLRAARRISPELLLNLLDNAARLEPQVLRDHWAGRGDLDKVLKSVSQNRDDLLKKNFWGVLRDMLGLQQENAAPQTPPSATSEPSEKTAS
ncbi:MAG: hypothetical protein HC915_17385 [Anaerolineae bacterium]|nr:hypothetical protein [Anaerolineae bacterium]